MRYKKEINSFFEVYLKWFSIVLFLVFLVSPAIILALAMNITKHFFWSYILILPLWFESIKKIGESHNNN